MDYAMKVRDLLVDRPEENPSEKLKEQLISRIANSERHKIRQLLMTKELGDRKPPQVASQNVTSAG